MALKLPKRKDEILSQIKSEYTRADQYIAPKRQEALERMRLYSNQTRNKELVGDTTLFTIFQTVFSKLYEDKLSVNFVPSHPDDDEKVGGLNPVAKYDYQQMQKDVVDYDWDWYTCFWGSGFLDVSEWDSKESIINPSVIPNETFLFDPNMSYINGDRRGFGAAAYWGREIAKSRAEMDRDESFYNYKNLTVKVGDLTRRGDQYRAQSQNYGSKDEWRSPGDNELIPLLEWWTHIDGEKYLVVTDAWYREIVRCQKWWSPTWPVIQRKLFPIPNDPLGVSIPDLVEDKQRAKAILTNLGLMSAKADLYPMYVYDRNAISPTTDLSFGFNKWVPSDGPVTASVAPLQKAQPGQLVAYIMSIIDDAAQRATAASSMLQGTFGSQGARSANETVRVFNAGEERISTGAKIFGWSERDFWRFWLRSYKKYFPKAKTKFIRIDGAFGPRFQEVTGDDFTFEKDPDIIIESKVISDAKNSQQKQDAIAFTNLTAQDASLNRRYHNKKLAQFFGYTKDQIDRLYPPSVDELKAEDENLSLNQNKFVPIDINDDHYTHLQIHAKADDSKASIVHIEAHKKAMLVKREQEAQLQAMQGQPSPNPTDQPLSVQQTPNSQGTGSAPSAEFIGPNRVQ